MYPTSTPHLRRLRPLLLLCLVGVAGLSACKKKKAAAPAVKPAQWQGLRMDMPRAKAEKLVRDAKLRVHCAPTHNVTYLKKNKLYTRWVKKAAAARVVRCKVRRKKGAKPGPDGVMETKLYFLDNKLVRLHAKVISTDVTFEQVLKNHFGTLKQMTLERYVYAGDAPSKTRAWGLNRLSTGIIWLRGVRRQQLAMFSTDAKIIQALEAVSSTRKGD